MDRVEPEYTMQAVVDRTGVPADTIRSWERRHGFPRPGRDRTNQRVYLEADIQAILRLTERRAAGWSIRQAINHLQATEHQPGQELDGASSSNVERSEKAVARSSSPRAHKELADLLDTYQAAKAKRFLSDALAFGSVEELLFSLLLPIATATAGGAEVPPFRAGFVRQELFSLYDASSPVSGRATILFAGVPATRGENHLLCHAILASRAGYQTLFLGADVALRDAEAALATTRPQAVMMTADSESSAWTLARWCHRLRHERPIEGWSGALLFSGQVFAAVPGLADDVDATYIPDDPSAARDTLDRSLANQQPSLHLMRES